MTWYVVYWTATGEADSFGTTIANPLPSDMTARPLTDLEADMITNGTGIWDPTTLTVIPRTDTP